MISASTPARMSSSRFSNSPQRSVRATNSRCLRSGSTTPTSSTPAISDNTRAWLLPMTPTPTTPIFNGLPPFAPGMTERAPTTPVPIPPLAWLAGAWRPTIKGTQTRFAANCLQRLGAACFFAIRRLRKGNTLPFCTIRLWHLRRFAQARLGISAIAGAMLHLGRRNRAPYRLNLEQEMRIMRPKAALSVLCLGLILAGAVPASSARAQTSEEGPAFGPELQGFDYPWPVSYFGFVSQGQYLRMAYMDVPPGAAANGRTAVLFHGKNFCAATWQDTIGVLRDAGYRVVAVDQIGFCKSSKPAHYQYSFQQLAGNTHALLASLGVTRAIVTGHSVGGMLGMRYALTFPEDVEQLVLVNPIGLEDWKAKGVPWQSVDDWYGQELKTTAAS